MGRHAPSGTSGNGTRPLDKARHAPRFLPCRKRSRLYGRCLYLRWLRRLHQPRLIDRSADERGEQRMRLEWPRFELRVELHADEPGMIWPFDNLRQQTVRRETGEAQAGGLQPVAVARVHLVAVTVALRDAGRAIDLRDFAAFGKNRLVGAEAHRAAEIAVSVTQLKVVAVPPFSHQPDHRLLGRAELARARVLDARIARGLDDCHLHAEADAKIKHAAGPRIARRLDLAFRGALAEAARNEYAVHVLEIGRGILALEGLGLEPLQIDLHLVGDAAMDQRLVQRFVRVPETCVFADHGNCYLAVGIADGFGNLAPALEVRLWRVRDAEGGKNFAIEPLGMIGAGHVIDARHVERLDHRLGPNIAEQRDLAPLVLGQRPVGAAEQDVGLDADRAKLFD